MYNIKINLYVLLITTLLAASGNVFAAEAATVAATVEHIDQALVEVGKSDFNRAQSHMKEARALAEKLGGDQEVIKQANGFVIQGQRQAKLGDVKNATEELNKAKALYKTLTE